MHFCMDEVYAILMCVPVLGWAVAWVRARIAMWRNRHQQPCCVHGENAIHGESGTLYEPKAVHCLIAPDVALCEFGTSATLDAGSVGSYRDDDVTCKECLDHMAP